jgi:hypothetical protein
MSQMNPAHPNLEMNETDRRLIKTQELKAQHEDALRKCVGGQRGARMVAIRSKIPLWHSTIFWAFGRVSHVGDVFIALRVPTDSEHVQRSIPWDHVEEIAFFTTVPTEKVLRARQIGACHGLPVSLTVKIPQNVKRKR